MRVERARKAKGVPALIHLIVLFHSVTLSLWLSVTCHSATISPSVYLAVSLSLSLSCLSCLLALCPWVSVSLCLCPLSSVLCVCACLCLCTSVSRSSSLFSLTWSILFLRPMCSLSIAVGIVLCPLLSLSVSLLSSPLSPFSQSLPPFSPSLSFSL